MRTFFASFSIFALALLIENLKGDFQVELSVGQYMAFTAFLGIHFGFIACVLLDVRDLFTKEI